MSAELKRFEVMRRTWIDQVTYVWAESIDEIRIDEYEEFEWEAIETDYEYFPAVEVDW